MIVEERKRQRAHEEEDNEEEQTATQQKDLLNFKKKSKSNSYFTQPKSIRSNNPEIHSNPHEQAEMCVSRTSLNLMHSSSSVRRHLTSASRREQSMCLKTYSRRRKAGSRDSNPVSPAGIDLSSLLLQESPNIQ